MKSYLAFLFIAIAVLMSSCEKVFFEEELESTSPSDNFEYLWNQCNEKYSYFGVKNIDWNVIRAKYEAQIYEGMSEDSLFNTLGSMLNELKDDHTNLISNFNVSSFRVRFYGPDNFDWRIIENNYIGRDYFSSGPFRHNFIHQGEVGYIRFASFTGTVDDKNLDYIINKYINTKGLILDIRENGGGSVSDLYSILSRFVDVETTLFYSRIKTGPGRSDFSEPEPSKVEPYDGPRYKNKVMVLVDRGTYSAGSFTSLATKALPNVMLVGDTTGGGLGVPNGGQLPNGWTYRFSVSQAMTLDFNPDYENGVPPDVFVRTDLSDRTKDDVIDRAILEINQ